MRSATVLILLLLVVFAVGAGGSYFTASSVGTWYAQLQKPAFSPPDWVFAPVWALLYIFMAVAMWLVWREEEGASQVTPPQAMWLAQLILNLGWSVIFFGLRLPGLALVEIILLWSAVLATTMVFFRVSKVAGALMVPYVLWVSFAAVLNFGIWYVN
ncbi:MAG: tryptophan-rich sensory protein [Armatimonadetes bacterium]|nr:tryptophan-rich sensory protein [Armatimonadota bacterium]